MRKIADVAGIVADATYPKGYKLEAQSTVVSVDLNQDMVQFFRKLMQDGNFTENGNFDNETNGYQSLTALLAYLRKNCLPDTGVTVGLSRAASLNEAKAGISDILFISPLILKSLNGGYERVTLNEASWNMTSTSTITVAHGLTETEYRTITNISVMIFADSVANFHKLDSLYVVSSSILNGSVGSIGDTTIQLLRSGSGLFANGSWSLASAVVSFDYIPD